MTRLSPKLKSEVLNVWYGIKDGMQNKAIAVQHISGDYLNIPFVVDGMPTNMAQWDVKNQRFNKLIVPVWKLDKVIDIDIPLPESKEPSVAQIRQQEMCNIVKAGVAHAIKEQLDETFNPCLGEQVADAACAKIDELMNLHRN